MKVFSCDEFEIYIVLEVYVADYDSIAGDIFWSISMKLNFWKRNTKLWLFHYNSVDSDSDSLQHWDLGPRLLTWVNFNHSMDMQLHPLYSLGLNYLSIPKIQLCNRWSLGMDM